MKNYRPYTLDTDNLEHSLSDSELRGKVYESRASHVRRALSVAENSTAITINSAVGRAGLGQNALSSSYKPEEPKPVEISEKTRLDAARVQQTHEFSDLLDRETPRQDQYTHELTELGKKTAATDPTDPLSVAAMQAAVEEAFANVDDADTFKDTLELV